MCGRFTSTVDPQLLAERFGIALPDGIEPRFNIAPTQRVLAVVDDHGSRAARLLRWGLVPHWAKDQKIGFKMINARAETVADKPAYRTLLAKHRCLILADGFYEWRVDPDGVKRPVRFTLASGEPFAFAGLNAFWRDPESDDVLESCTIITTTANGLVAPVHDRMPVILPREAEASWLDPSTDRERALLLLRPLAVDLMLARDASTLVNSARNDAPELLDPLR